MLKLEWIEVPTKTLSKNGLWFTYTKAADLGQKVCKWYAVHVVVWLMAVVLATVFTFTRKNLHIQINVHDEYFIPHA